MSRHIHSQRGFFNTINHYDEDGFMGHSEQDCFGGIRHYDKDGNFLGYSQESILGSGYNHYSDSGEFIGTSSPGLFGGYVHHGEDLEGYSGNEYFGAVDTVFDNYEEEEDD